MLLKYFIGECGVGKAALIQKELGFKAIKMNTTEELHYLVLILTKNNVIEQAKIGHNWKNPVWRNSDGTIAEW